jgi:hypothetical protein
MSLLYQFRKTTEELKRFHSSKVLKKIRVEFDGVILSRGELCRAWSSWRQPRWAMGMDLPTCVVQAQSSQLLNCSGCSFGLGWA